MLTLAGIEGLSLRALYHRLSTRPLWARLFNLNPASVPHLATLARRKKDPRLRRLRSRLDAKLASLLAGGRVAVIDSSALVANQRVHPNANWGYSSKGIYYGYQLHLTCDLNGAILSHTTTKASVKSKEQAQAILKRSKTINKELKILCRRCSL
ncbi:MAG: transposase [Firmicutes bacterium]|nr:transposase [Bacillota bacterium]